MTDLVWDMTHSNMMWHSYVASLIYMGHDSFYMRHDWFNMGHDSFMYDVTFTAGMTYYYAACLIYMSHVSFICHMSHSYVPWLVDMQHDSASFLAGIEKPSTWNTGPGQILKAWFDPSSIQKKYQTNVMISSHRHAKMSFWLSFWQMDQKSKICQKDKLRDDVTKLSHLNKFQKNGMFLRRVKKKKFSIQTNYVTMWRNHYIWTSSRKMWSCLERVQKQNWNLVALYWA